MQNIFLSCSFILLSTGISGFLTECPLLTNVGPANLDLPLFFKEKTKIKFLLDSVSNPTIEKISNSHFRIKEDFGIIEFGPLRFKVNQLDMFSNSLHKLAGQEFPLEFIFSASKQVFEKKTKAKKAKSKGNKHLKELTNDIPNIMKFSLLFEEATVPFVELYQLGFGRGMIKRLADKRKDPKESSLDLHTIFNADDLLDKISKVVWYEAQSVMDNCQKSLFLVLFEKLWVSHDQLDEFTEHVVERINTSSKLTESLSTNFLVES